MPPFDRHSKTPPMPKPVSGFDAPANSRKIARTPWEREDDDEFGPPAALDLTPADAESEAKRMVYETTHPLNEALMQNAHLDHNRAMRRYAALARRAWDPAARDIPVRPARIVGEDGPAGRATAAPVSTPDSPLVKTTAPAAAGSNLLRAAERNSFDVPLRSAQSGPASGSKRPKQDGTATPAGAPTSRPLPSDEILARVEAQRQIMRDTIAHIGGDDPLDPQIYADRAEGEAQARDRGAAARRNDPGAGAPPHAIDLDRLADAAAAVRAREDFSETTKYILLGLMSYEDIVPDIAGRSFGGISESTFNDYRDFVSEWRVLEGREGIMAESADQLSLDELVDFQYAYLIVDLSPDIAIPNWSDYERREGGQELYEEARARVAPAIAASNILENFGPNVIAYQIADSVFNYGSEGRIYILQYAVNMTISNMTPRQRSAGEYELIEADGEYGEKTAAAVQALANDPVHQRTFLEHLRLGRARWSWDHDQYRGNNRWRIWGITAR